MIRAKDQLTEEASYPHLGKFLQSGGKLEVGEDLFLGAFACLRKGNRTIVVEAAYRDLAAVMKEMDAQARNHFEQESSASM